MEDVHSACETGDWETVRRNIRFLTGRHLRAAIQYNHVNIVDGYYSMIRHLNPGKVHQNFTEWCREATYEENYHSPDYQGVIPQPVMDCWLVSGSAYRDRTIWRHHPGTGKVIGFNAFCGVFPLKWEMFTYLFGCEWRRSVRWWANLYWEYHAWGTPEARRIATHIRDNISGVRELSPHSEEPRMPISDTTMETLVEILSPEEK